MRNYGIAAGRMKAKNVVLSAQVEKLREALISLYQLQQGPPSPNHEEEWRVAMRLAEQTLKETE